MSDRKLSTDQSLYLFNKVIQPLTDRQSKNVLCYIAGYLGYLPQFWSAVKDAVETEHEIDRRGKEATRD